MSDAVLSSRPLFRAPDPRPVRALLGMALAGLALLGTSALVVEGSRPGAGREAEGRPSAPAAPPPKPAPAWVEIERPFHAFEWSAPALRGLEAGYAARRLGDASLREDRLGFGVPGRDALFARLLVRRGATAADRPSLFAATTREAARVGLAVDRATAPVPLKTRFGPFETSDAVLRDLDGRPLACHAFRAAPDAAAIEIGGLVCARAAQSLAPAALACMIERLDLAEGGGDPDLVAFFAASERARDPGCAGADLSPNRRGAGIIDDNPATRRASSRRR